MFLHEMRCDVVCFDGSAVPSPPKRMGRAIRNCMICTLRMGDNDMRKPRMHTKFVSTLYYLYKLFCSSKKAVLVLKM